MSDTMVLLLRYLCLMALGLQVDTEPGDYRPPEPLTQSELIER